MKSWLLKNKLLRIIDIAGWNPACSRVFNFLNEWINYWSSIIIKLLNTQEYLFYHPPLPSYPIFLCFCQPPHLSLRPHSYRKRGCGRGLICMSRTCQCPLVSCVKQMSPRPRPRPLPRFRCGRAVTILFSFFQSQRPPRVGSIFWNQCRQPVGQPAPALMSDWRRQRRHSQIVLLNCLNGESSINTEVYIFTYLLRKNVHHKIWIFLEHDMMNCFLLQGFQFVSVELIFTQLDDAFILRVVRMTTLVIQALLGK